MAERNQVEGKYKIHKQGFRYYVVPESFCLSRLPYPANFLSFFFKSDAEETREVLEKAFQDGVLYEIYQNVIRQHSLMQENNNYRVKSKCFQK